MTEEESPYVILQNLAVDDINKILTTICGTISEGSQSNNKAILTFMKKNFCFIRRGIPASVFKSPFISKIVFLESINSVDSTGKIVSICLDDPNEVKYSLQQLNLLPNYEKSLIIIPRITTLVQESIDKSGVKLAHVFEYHLDIIPLEKYFFIIPSPNCFQRCFVEDDISDVYTIARALLRLQIFTGCPTRTFTAGKVSSRVHILLDQFKTQVGESYFSANRSAIKDPYFDDVFIIDRTADLITPLSTQFYYGGMLDELYGVDFGYLKLPSNVTIPDFPDKREVLLSDANDEVFEVMRGCNIIDALQCAELKRAEIHELTELMKKTSGTKQWSMYAMKAKHMTQVNPILVMHYSLLESVTEMKKRLRMLDEIEYRLIVQASDGFDAACALINRGELNSIVNGLRLFCLASVACGGFSASKVADIQRRVFDRFGPDAVKDIVGLEKAGLLLSQTLIQSLIRAGVRHPTYFELDKAFDLISASEKAAPDVSLASLKNTLNNIKNFAEKKIDEVNSALNDRGRDIDGSRSNTEKKIDDGNRKTDAENNEAQKSGNNESGIEKGYDSMVPLLLRIVQSAIDGKWQSQNSPQMKMLRAMGLSPEVHENLEKSDTGEERKRPKIRPKRVLVVVVGGVTSTEVQLFVQLGKKVLNEKYEFCVASTDITYGNKLIGSICPEIKKKLEEQLNISENSAQS